MEYSVEAYLRRLPTEKIETFLQDYLNGVLKEDFSGMIGAVEQELSRRKGENLRQAITKPDNASVKEN